MPLQATSGAASYDAFGGGVPFVPTYIEDVFSTWLYTGNGSTQTINNGIDLAGKGGLVWSKSRSSGSFNHILVDTVRGAGKGLFSDLTNAQNASMGGLTGFTSTGYELSGSVADLNSLSQTFASWTFREQPKFFDVVTYTGNGANRTIPHNLGSVPGCIIIKCLDDTFDWIVWHRSFAANNQNAFLNTTDAAGAYGVSSSTAPTSTVFSLTTSPYTNSNGKTYVAYLFAHDAGGFGLTGTDNVISCGSFTDPASGNTTEVNLGYEPQWLLVKPNLATTDWYLVDNMRGMVRGTSTRILNPNLSAAESNGFANGYYQPTATGFTAGNTVTGGGGTTCIYIAIRRGPMRTPTTGTSVFSPNAQNTGTTPLVTTNFPVDLSIGTDRTGASRYVVDRLRGTTASSSQYLETNSTIAEAASGGGLNFANNTGFTDAFLGYSQSIFWNFRRAPGFFDEVCYTGDGGNPQTVSHNLGVAPEMVIVKRRSAGAAPNWTVGLSFTSTPYRDGLYLNATNALIANDNEINGATASTIAVRNTLSSSGGTFVSYLFASCPGVSKVGSYTGTGATQVINCGFTAGSRFVLIKRTDSTGDWYVWDSARGIVAGNDPYLLLNSTAAEVTNTDFIDTAATGFEISSTAPAAINANGGTFIFLAIA